MISENNIQLMSQWTFSILSKRAPFKNNVNTLALDLIFYFFSFMKVDKAMDFPCTSSSNFNQLKYSKQATLQSGNVSVKESH